MTRSCGLVSCPLRSFQIVVVLIFSPVTSWILKTTWASDRRPRPDVCAVSRTQLTLSARVLGGAVAALPGAALLVICWLLLQASRGGRARPGLCTAADGGPAAGEYRVRRARCRGQAS